MYEPIEIMEKCADNIIVIESYVCVRARGECVWVIGWCIRQVIEMPYICPFDMDSALQCAGIKIGVTMINSSSSVYTRPSIQRERERVKRETTSKRCYRQRILHTEHDK